MTQQRLRTLARRLMFEYLPVDERCLGDYKITGRVLQAGSKEQIVGIRNAMFAGFPVTSMRLSQPYRLQTLTGPDGVWMTNMPCELVQMHTQFAARARGRVLVAGLGLGCVLQLLRNNRRVRHVTVVERQKEVIDLCGRHYPEVDLVHTDFFDFARQLGSGCFDEVFLDIWQSNGEWPWQTQVVPLRRMLYGKVRRVFAWAEDVMLGQVSRGLFRAADSDPQLLFTYATNHYYAFRRGLEALGIRNHHRIDSNTDWTIVFKLEQENLNDRHLRDLVQIFCTTIGSPRWEEVFGPHWDAATRQ